MRKPFIKNIVSGAIALTLLGTSACRAPIGMLDADAEAEAAADGSLEDDAPKGTDGKDGTNGNNGNDGNDGNNGEDNDPVTNPNDPVIASYFVEWGIYGRDYHVADIPADKLTHVLYGFIPICGDNTALAEANPNGHAILQSQCAGKPDHSVVIHDTVAALEKSYPGDKWDDPIRGNFGELIRMKAKHPHIKVLPSVGGWTLSDPFFAMARTAASRKVFIDSVSDFLRTYDFFDGVDLDWEFPGGNGATASLGAASDGQAYADLMAELRTALDALETETGRSFLLTSAVGSAPKHIDAVNYADAVKHMDLVFAMNYDFYGGWNNDLGHHTALYESSNNDLHTGYNTAAAMQNLLAAGVPANKLVMGAAMYGRGWKGVNGVQNNQPFTGVGDGPIDGTWEDGVLDYKAIVTDMLASPDTGKNGFVYSYDQTAEAPSLYNQQKGELVTYDNARSVAAKGKYVRDNGLAGLFAWEIDADNGDILNAMNNSL